MVDNEYSKGDYRSSKISVGAAMKNLEMLKVIPDHLKSEKRVVMQFFFFFFFFVIRYIPDKYNTKYMCNKAILENGETPKSVLN